MALNNTPPYSLHQELDWLAAVLDARLRLYFEMACDVSDVQAVAVPQLPPDSADPYARLVQEHALGWGERLVLALALAPHLRPQVLDGLLVRNATYDRPYTEFGGFKGKGHAGFLPTAETALFLLAGTDLALRLAYQASLWTDSPLTTARLVQLGEAQEPPLSVALAVAPDILALLLTGERPHPHQSADFPAQHVTTPLTWADLVLDADLRDQLTEIRTWLEHWDEMLQNPHLRRHFKPGYRALFYGPPGTGKTLAAMLLGQVSSHEVYRIDLSTVVSKDIGETERRLSRVFDTAERGRWILLFDEADALIGKRPASSHGYATQETAYLLRRIEDFPGLVILTSSLKGKPDDAFARRFQSVIHFPLPGPAEREQLWQQAFDGAVEVADDVDFALLANQYEVAGGAIVNVLRYCILRALPQQQVLTRADMLRGLQKELAKEKDLSS